MYENLCPVGNHIPTLIDIRRLKRVKLLNGMMVPGTKVVERCDVCNCILITVRPDLTTE